MNAEQEEAIRLRQINQRIARRHFAEECEEKGLSPRYVKISQTYANNRRREELREERQLRKDYPDA